jgi:hypothetical protein
MAVTITEKLYQELLGYLQSQPEDDVRAEELHQQLQQVEIDRVYEELKIEGKVTTTKSGAWIIG